MWYPWLATLVMLPRWWCSLQKQPESRSIGWEEGSHYLWAPLVAWELTLGGEMNPGNVDVCHPGRGRVGTLRSFWVFFTLRLPGFLIHKWVVFVCVEEIGHCHIRAQDSAHVPSWRLGLPLLLHGLPRPFQPLSLDKHFPVLLVFKNLQCWDYQFYSFSII